MWQEELWSRMFEQTQEDAPLFRGGRSVCQNRGQTDRGQVGAERLCICERYAGFV
jgi:hypothetical protein